MLRSVLFYLFPHFALPCPLSRTIVFSLLVSLCGGASSYRLLDCPPPNDCGFSAHLMPTHTILLRCFSCFPCSALQLIPPPHRFLKTQQPTKPLFSFTNETRKRIQCLSSSCCISLLRPPFAWHPRDRLFNFTPPCPPPCWLTCRWLAFSSPIFRCGEFRVFFVYFIFPPSSSSSFGNHEPNSLFSLPEPFFPRTQPLFPTPFRLEVFQRPFGFFSLGPRLVPLPRRLKALFLHDDNSPLPSVPDSLFISQRL